MELGTDVHCSEVAVVRQSHGAALLAHAVAWSAHSGLLARVVAGVASSICCRGNGWSSEAVGSAVLLLAWAEGAGVPLGASWEEGLDGIVV